MNIEEQIEKIEEEVAAIDSLGRAEILIEALPYIQRFAGTTVVVKYGGNAMIDEELKDQVMRDIVMLQQVGIHVVVVHGGGPEINELLKRLSIESKFIGGLRYTDKETVEVVQMVLAGKVCKNLVVHLASHGGKAIGLCGLDGGMIKANKMSGEDDLGFVGEINEINTDIIEKTIKNGYIPIISTVAAGYNGEVFNINADTAASRIAAELQAERLLLMTDIAGLLRDKDDPSTLIPEINVSQVPGLRMQGIIQGGMIPKVDCCVEAVRRGVKSVSIIDGRVPHSILVELFTDQGSGTVVY